MNKEKEICVKVLDDFDTIKNKLFDLGFKVQEDFYLEDIYFVKKEESLNKDNIDKLLSDYILLRNRVGKEYLFTIKRKESLSVKSIKCPIKDFALGYKFLEELGYKKILELKDHNVLFTNDKNEIYVQDVDNLGVYIEMEQKNLKLENNNGDTIDEMINNLNSYHFNIDKSNYFKKKAYDMLSQNI